MTSTQILAPLQVGLELLRGSIQSPASPRLIVVLVDRSGLVVGPSQDKVSPLTHVERVLVNKNATFNCLHCNFYHDILDIPNCPLGLVHVHI